MFDFKDGIPKTSVQVKYREGLDRKTAEEIKYGLLYYITDFTILVSEKYALDDFFSSVIAPQSLFIYFITSMMLILGFFMTAVSYTQKMQDLSYEQGVLRSIGLT